MFVPFESSDGTHATRRARGGRKAWAWLAVCACAGIACVSDAAPSSGARQVADADGGTTDEVATPDGPLMPMTVGSRWTYRVQEGDETYTKIVLVEAEEEVGGDGPYASASAAKLVTTEGGKVESIKWQGVDGTRVVRYREQELSKKTGEVNGDNHWDPPRLVVDASRDATSAGASWVETYEETQQADGRTESTVEKDTWSIEAVDAEVTVPAGTFRALVVQRRGKSKVKTFWFVPGIGKVKEDGDVLEVLTGYEVAP